MDLGIAGRKALLAASSSGLGLACATPLRQQFMADRMVKEQGIDLAEARRRIAGTIAAKRFGKPSEFADACAFLCSAQAGFISGQNLQLDGGSYAGLI